MGPVQAREVEVAPVEDTKGVRFDDEAIQHVDVVDLAVADVDATGDRPAQVELRAQLDGAFGCHVACAGEHCAKSA